MRASRENEAMLCCICRQGPQLVRRKAANHRQSLKRTPRVPASITTITAHYPDPHSLPVCVSLHSYELGAPLHLRLLRRVCLCVCANVRGEKTCTCKLLHTHAHLCVCRLVIYHLSLNRPPSQKLMK